MKQILFIAMLIASVSNVFGQEIEPSSNTTKKMVELFNHFYDHEKLEVNVILDHGVDLKFISQIRDRNFEIITKSETSNYNTYLLFHTLDIQENVGRVRYKIVNSKVPQEFKYLRFDINTYQLIKH